MSLHEFLGEFFGPGAKSKASSDVADLTCLHSRESFHIRILPVELLFPIRWFGILEPDDLAADVFVEVTLQTEA